MFDRIQLVTLAGFASLSYVLAQLPAGCDRNYTVVFGDDCNSISAAQNVSTFQLAEVNPGINAECSNLFAGEVLCLGITGQDCTNTTVVQPGDFCGLISENTGVDISTLLANNPNVNSDCTNLVVGEVLCTASTIIPYSS